MTRARPSIPIIDIEGRSPYRRERCPVSYSPPGAVSIRRLVVVPIISSWFIAPLRRVHSHRSLALPPAHRVGLSATHLAHGQQTSLSSSGVQEHDETESRTSYPASSPRLDRALRRPPRKLLCEPSPHALRFALGSAHRR